MNKIKTVLIFILGLLLLYRIPNTIKNQIPQKILETLFYEYTFYFMIILFGIFFFMITRYLLNKKKQSQKILSNKEKTIILLIIIFALIIRLGFSPMYDYARSGGWEYRISAKNMLTEHEYKLCIVGEYENCILYDHTDHNAGYPFILAMIFSIFGLIIRLPIYLNLLLASLSTGLIYLIVKNLYRRNETNKTYNKNIQIKNNSVNKVGVFAAIIYSLMNAHIIYSGTGEVTVFMAFFITLSFYFATIPKYERTVLLDALTIISLIVCVAIQITNVALIFVLGIMGVPEINKYYGLSKKEKKKGKKPVIYLTYLIITLIAAACLIPFAYLFTVDISTSQGTPISTNFIQQNINSFIAENLIIIHPVVITLFFLGLAITIFYRIKKWYKNNNQTKYDTKDKYEIKDIEKEKISNIRLTPLLALMLAYIGLYLLLFATHMERYTVDIYPAIVIISALTLGYILDLKSYLKSYHKSHYKKIGLLICIIIILTIVPTSRPLHKNFLEYKGMGWTDSSAISKLLKEVPNDYLLVTSTHSESHRARFDKEMKISPFNSAYGGYFYLKDKKIAFIDSGGRIENDNKENEFVKRYKLKLVDQINGTKLYLSANS